MGGDTNVTSLSVMGSWWVMAWLTCATMEPMEGPTSTHCLFPPASSHIYKMSMPGHKHLISCLRTTSSMAHRGTIMPTHYPVNESPLIPS